MRIFFVDIFRLKLKICIKIFCEISRSAIFSLKISSSNPFIEEILEQYDPFMRELSFYQDVLPKIEELFLSVKDYTMLTKKYVKVFSDSKRDNDVRDIETCF